jgi:hypothetical protein
VYANSEVVGVQSVSLGIGSSTTLQFAWNTSGLGRGDYTISASASIIQGEVDTADNSKVADSIVTILSQGHDVAVTSVTPSKKVVGQGYSTLITVAATNYGIFNESFDITVYVNTTAIQTQTATLFSGDSVRLNFVWNTSGFVKGNYTVSAYAWPVPGETNYSDNSYTDGTVKVSVPGDVDGSGRVDVGDLGRLGNAWFSTPSSPNWNPNADINDSGRIDLGDLGILNDHWYQSDP